MDESGNERMPDEPSRRVPARPAGPRNQEEPRPAVQPGGDVAAGAAGGGEEVPQGGAIGPGPATAEPHDS